MFIVIEGIDGAGCETQAVNLQKWLKNNKIPCSFVKYPNYGANVGKFIREFLYKNKGLSPELQFLLYCAQFLFDREFIKNERKNKILVADRYFSTTLCFQTLAGIEIKKALRFAEDFGIEKPDLIFYLNVRPNIAIKRKLGEKKEKNWMEKDFRNIGKTYKQYHLLVKNQVWAKWVNIDGEKDIDEITKQIFDMLKPCEIKPSV